MRNWVKIRRAMLRMPLDRIGYGGYLSLANQFPEFIDHVTQISSEFEQYLTKTQRTQSHQHRGKVAILNAWGQARAWLQQQAREQRFFVPPRPDVMELVGSNPLECLSGLPFEIQFISFEDILTNGIDDDIKVIINMGEANTAWSGAENWNNPQVLSCIRQFVAQGGGLLGIGDPSAWQANGRYYQLGDVLGVEKEIALTMGRVASPIKIDREHELSQYVTNEVTFDGLSYVYAHNQDTRVLASNGQHVALAASEYGNGRSIYASCMSFNMETSRLLEHILIWLMSQEETKTPYLSNNPHIDVAYYPHTQQLALVNASPLSQTTTFQDHNNHHHEINLKGYEWRWESMDTSI